LRRLAATFVKLQAGQRVRLPDAVDFVTIDGMMEVPGSWKLYLKSVDGLVTTLLTQEQVAVLTCSWKTEQPSPPSC
jgi:hypothetical protein